ncbi:cadherin-5 [Polypterus senegalus]|uniref:cadherin-5 n=1 Tax=Polypterus senegalus TaxID=55291 RepID=UPI0019654669|nr:cadherin-5 [Polypterus senegalus]
MGACIWVVFCIMVHFIPINGLVVKSPNIQSVLHRHKREFKWNMMYVFENMSSKSPISIGKLSSSKFNRTALFILRGEGVDQGEKGIFTVNKLGDVFVHKTLDREKKAIYNLNVLAMDEMTRNLLEPETSFQVKVMDINDNEPKFDLNEYNVSFYEGPYTEAKVLTVHAADPDDPTVLGHAEVEYKIFAPKGFYIVESTGDIKYLGTLDRERNQTYKFIVQAKDMPKHSNTGFTSTATVIINLKDINDNKAKFIQSTYTFNVSESTAPGVNIGALLITDKDEPQNTNPQFNPTNLAGVFEIVEDADLKNGKIILRKELDYETRATYHFQIEVTETIVFPDKDDGVGFSTATVTINVLDEDEPPVFSPKEYHFAKMENVDKGSIGKVNAIDPDTAKNQVRYSIKEDSVDSLGIDSNTGIIFIRKLLDRETKAWHNFTVKATEINKDGTQGKESFASVHLKILDENDNPPELNGTTYLVVCEDSKPETVVATLSVTDKDEMTLDTRFTFHLKEENTNFTLVPNLDNTANIIAKYGGFRVNEDDILTLIISDNGSPPKSSTTTLTIHVCPCIDGDRMCEVASAQMGVSVQALLAILFCILTILIITLLFLLRRKLKKEPLGSLGKGVGEIHEQLVSYDEEGGGEMDTNGYDVSVLSSAWQNGIRPRPESQTGPCLYATVQKPAIKQNMEIMIEVKKDEADHDKDGIPYDTLHIYGYEGQDSLAGSLSSINSSSCDSDLDYDFINDWGPRFKTLAELYGVDEHDAAYMY